MSKYLTAYGITVIVFLAIDFIWLAFVARSLYVDSIGHLMRDQPLLGAAGLFYAVYVIGIVIFAISPALRTDNWSTALIFGALFGFFAYATYDATNYATLRDWPLSISLIDTAWGTALTGISAVAGFWGTRLLMPSAVG